MTTVQITLNDDVVAQLQRLADEEQVSVETLIASIAKERACRAESSGEAARMARAHLARYPDLFKRLAQ